MCIRDSLAGVTSLLLRNQDWFQGLDYQLDKIDLEDASISSLGLIYPAISLQKLSLIHILSVKKVTYMFIS